MENEGSEVLSQENIRFTGTQVNYYFVCKRKLWLFSHNMELESESDLVHLGKLLHENSYKRKFKEVQIDRIKIDFLEQKKEETREASMTEIPDLGLEYETDKSKSIVLHEIKRSKSMEEAHTFQLLYYIYCLKKYYNANVGKGILHYPLLKTNVPIELTKEREIQIEEMIRDIMRIISLPGPPEPVRLRYCKSCAYNELCWG